MPRPLKEAAHNERGCLSVVVVCLGGALDAVQVDENLGFRRLRH